LNASASFIKDLASFKPFAVLLALTSTTTKTSTSYKSRTYNIPMNQWWSTQPHIAWRTLSQPYAKPFTSASESHLPMLHALNKLRNSSDIKQFFVIYVTDKQTAKR
jgi:hypothetical protein